MNLRDVFSEISHSLQSMKEYQATKDYLLSVVENDNPKQEELILSKNGKPVFKVIVMDVQTHVQTHVQKETKHD